MCVLLSSDIPVLLLYQSSALSRRAPETVSDLFSSPYTICNHYRRWIEVHNGIFWWIWFLFHGLSIINKEYKSFETETKDRTKDGKKYEKIYEKNFLLHGQMDALQIGRGVAEKSVNNYLLSRWD